MLPIIIIVVMLVVVDVVVVVIIIIIIIITSSSLANSKERSRSDKFTPSFPLSSALTPCCCMYRKL